MSETQESKLHILSHQRRSEFLSGGSIVRFEMIVSGDSSVPAMYIKSNIIDLFFVTRNPTLSLDLIDIGNDIFLYVVGIDEGSEHPYYLYSCIETLSEKRAIEMVLGGEAFDIFLFNDFAIEIARSEGVCNVSSKGYPSFANFAPSGPDYFGVNNELMADAVNDYASEKVHDSHEIILKEFIMDAHSHIYSGVGNVMRISGFTNFTEVHEMLPQIVGDHTFLKFIHSPNVLVSEGNAREFSDAMVVGDSSLLSIQAKCFDFEGDVLPSNRENAVKRMRKNIKKAIDQTKGSSRMIHEGKTILQGQAVLDVSKTSTFLFGIFVPSLDLISDDLNEHLTILSGTLHKRGHELVVLDPMQFLRTVQAADGIGMKYGSTPDEMFFNLLSQNSQQAHDSGKFSRPTLYRW